jgi:hypothetical protein
MAQIAQFVVCLLWWIFPQILALRYGSKPNTLHIPEPREETYYGSGFQTIVSEPLTGDSSVSFRSKRDLTQQLSSNIAHTVI